MPNPKDDIGLTLFNMERMLEDEIRRRRRDDYYGSLTREERAELRREERENRERQAEYARLENERLDALKSEFPVQIGVYKEKLHGSPKWDDEIKYIDWTVYAAKSFSKLGLRDQVYWERFSPRFGEIIEAGKYFKLVDRWPLRIRILRRIARAFGFKYAFAYPKVSWVKWKFQSAYRFIRRMVKLSMSVAAIAIVAVILLKVVSLPHGFPSDILQVFNIFRFTNSAPAKRSLKID